jgi:hypothetical protein
MRLEDLLPVPARGKPLEDELHRDPGAGDHRRAHHNARLGFDVARHSCSERDRYTTQAGTLYH